MKVLRGLQMLHTTEVGVYKDVDPPGWRRSVPLRRCSLLVVPLNALAMTPIESCLSFQHGLSSRHLREISINHVQ